MSKEDPVLDLEKALEEVFSNTKYPESDPEEALLDTNEKGSPGSTGFTTVLYCEDEQP